MCLEIPRDVRLPCECALGTTRDMVTRVHGLFSHFLFASALGVLVLSSACGRGLPDIPSTPTAAEGFRPTAAVPTPAGLDADPAIAMQLLPGDVVSMQTISADTTTVAGLTVDERGMLHLPLVGDVEVAGLSLVDAESRIEEALEPFDRTARVTLLMQEPAGQQASVLGAVGTPGRYHVVPGLRLADLLALAGGTTTIEEEGMVLATSDLASARLVRNGEVVPVSLALALTGNPRHNIRVRPGDHLYVPPTLNNFVTVLGEVHSASLVRYRPGIRLTTAIAMAGGTTRDADHSDLIVMRGENDSRLVYEVELDHVLDGDADDPILAPGDVVYVHSSGVANFRDAMTAISPLVSIAATSAIGVAIAQTAQ